MAEVLASLKKIGGSGEQYTETVLWTNPSPSSNFAAQTITLSDSLSNYKYIGIRFKIHNTHASTPNATGIMLVSEFVQNRKNTGTDRRNILVASQNTNNATMARNAWYVSDTSIEFSVAYQISSTNTNTSYVIPLEILGINELAHQTVVGKYAVTDIQKITANTVATFATRGKALAIWFTFGNRSSSVLQALTNVNPTTGEINNNEVYYAYYSGTSQLGQWTLTTNTFIVTDNSISTSAALSSSDRWGYIGYTYE